MITIELDDPWLDFIPDEIREVLESYGPLEHYQKRFLFYKLKKRKDFDMTEFKYPFVETVNEFVEAFVMLKDLYKNDPIENAGASVYLKDNWYLKLNKHGQISLMNDEYGMVSGEDTFFDRHPSTMALILRDYLAMLFD